MSDLNIKTNFPVISAKDWRALVETGLRGAAFESLSRETEDGIRRGPLFCAEDLPPKLAALGRTDVPLLDGRGWHIAAPVTDDDFRHANTQLLQDLKGGASAIRIQTNADISSSQDLKRILEGVHTDLVPIHFAHENGLGKLDLARSMKNLKTAVLWVGLDPILDKAILKAKPADIPDQWRLMTLQTFSSHNRGGTDVQELAVLAAGMAKAMRAFGAEFTCRHLTIDIAADRDTHLTIAKFRAARRLVLRIADAFGVDGASIPICAVISSRMMQTEDAWTNLLRIKSATIGAVLGGADMVTTRPFTDGLGKATPFAHRIARNMQLMMMEESHFGHVNDPALGSYWHERLTEDLAQSAWVKFQSIEAQGGLQAYRNSSQFQSDLKTPKEARAQRADPILGVTLHPAENVKTPELRP